MLPSVLTGDSPCFLQTGIGEQRIVILHRQPATGGFLRCGESQNHSPVFQDGVGFHRSDFLCRKGSHRQQCHQHDHYEKSG